VGGVFVNYRTGDGDWAALLIARELSTRFGADQVFHASRSIRPGDDFADEIEQRLANSDVLLAVIGDRWLLANDDLGNRRLDNADDWVRHEIRTAFAHKVRVIPVLLDDVAPLSESDLPHDIAALARCQYLRMHHRDRDDREVAALVDELTTLLPSAANEPWRVRIRDVSGVVRGAGVLLDNEYVLTCAHVLIDAGDKIIVEFVGLRHTPRINARIIPEWCAWPRDDQRGDVALLQLDQQVPNRVGATLRRTALSWDRAVRVCGFPRGLENGVYTHATLTGHGGRGGEWLQMNARRPGEQRVRVGFSGAGVVDHKTGDVLGIVVGEYTDEAANLSWMIPAETILSHIPRVAEWVTGDAAADEVFNKPSDPDVDHSDLARILTDWLARRDTGDCMMIIVGPDTAVMYRAVALSSREQQTVVTDPREGTTPAIGSIDLAVDASGKTVDDVSRRILNRAGIPLDVTVRPSEQVRVGIPPMTIVVDGVDNAKQPGALLNDVLKPLVERDSRLVLGFREESSPSLAMARSWDIGTIGRRLERLAKRINTLEVAEQQLMSLRSHIHDLSPIDCHGATLQVALSELRKVAANSDSDLTRRLLEKCEQRAAQASRQSAKAKAQLEEWLGERNALRGCLSAYKAKANDDGLAEDVGVAALYRKAHELLWRSPTDLSAAREAVRNYRLAIRRSRGVTDGKDSNDTV
jgi:serine protease Do